MEDKKFLRKESDWPVVLLYLYLHFSIVLCPFLLDEAMISTYLFGALLTFLGLLGTTVGAHRLWAHKTFVANKKFKIFLMICHTISGQGTIYNWVLQHRLHHKYFNTHLDPFNNTKSFLHLQTVTRTLKPAGGYETIKSEVETEDLDNDCVVMFQKKYYWIMYPILALLLPINAPAEYWGEGLINSFIIIGVIRYLIGCHLSSFIETSAKLNICEPIEKNNDKALLNIIENHKWATYHYLAPWDYQSGEFGYYGNDIFSKCIRVCENFGLAEGLKTLDRKTIGQALQIAKETNKPVAECLMDSQFIDVKHSQFRRSH
nr:acyl-CoA desaturase 1 [Onthophagus taurus]